MSTKYVLREFYKLCDGGVCQDLLNEQEKRFVRDGGMILSGIAQEADNVNGNGRVYPFNILRREVELYKKLIQENRATGELDHPEDTVINLKNVSHQIIDVWMEGKKVFVKMKVLSTPSGQILRALVNDGIAIGLSSRGLGSVKDVGGKLMVEDDFQLICWDVVQEPSVKTAFMSLNEAKNLNLSSKADKINRALNDILRK